MSPFRTIEASDDRFGCDGLRFLTVKSLALRGRADISVWLPEGCESLATLPIVILLHGVYGSHWAWALKGGAHVTAARLIAEGAIPPMALAMPSDGLWGDGSGYLAHPHLDFERWIAKEVPAAVQTVLPAGIDTPLALCGLSMGGFGALRMGAKYGRERFFAVSAHSSITEFSQMALFVEEPLESYGVRSEDETVLRTALANPQNLPALRFDCGTSDPLIEHNRALHRALAEHGVAHVYEEFDGGHEWPYWEAHVADSLRFFGQAGVQQRPIAGNSMQVS